MPDHHNSTNSVAVWTGLTILIAAVFTVRAARKLWRYWQTIKDMVEDPDAAESAMGSPYAILRIGIFGLNLFMAFVLSVVSIFGPKSPLPDLLAGTGTSNGRGYDALRVLTGYLFFTSPRLRVRDLRDAAG